MGKIVKLTESDLSKIVKKIITESKKKYYVAQNADTLRYDVINQSNYNVVRSFDDEETAKRYIEFLKTR
jgi:hypothetical protein